MHEDHRREWRVNAGRASPAGRRASRAASQRGSATAGKRHGGDSVPVGQRDSRAASQGGDSVPVGQRDSVPAGQRADGRPKTAAPRQNSARWLRDGCCHARPSSIRRASGVSPSWPTRCAIGGTRRWRPPRHKRDVCACCPVGGGPAPDPAARGPAVTEEDAADTVAAALALRCTIPRAARQIATARIAVRGLPSVTDTWMRKRCRCCGST